MFLPAGRDVLAPGTEIMPGDDKLLAKLYSDTSGEGYGAMWAMRDAASNSSRVDRCG